ncbi:MAG: M48 family metallopeptidase [Dehalococcoidia bacterium]
MRRGLGGIGILLPLVVGGVIAFSVWCSAEENEVPVTGREQRVAIGVEQQEDLGEQAYADILNQEAAGIVESGEVVEMVQRIGADIEAAVGADDPGFEWEYTVIESPTLNAFCLPGGKVVVYTGIIELAGNEDRLATVMAHEIAHAIAQHGAERMLQQQLTEIAQTSLAASLSSPRRRAGPSSRSSARAPLTACCCLSAATTNRRPTTSG